MARYNPSSSSSNSVPEKHEVFISFRSEDTGRTFTSHLNGALKRLDIRTYVADSKDNLPRGNEIPSALVRAIKEANLSVIVFSKNYAASEWCLDEVVEIVDCGRTKGQIIVPVFYDVEPSCVRYQRESYGEAFAKHERNVVDKVKVTKWRDGLVEAAGFSGWDCKVERTELEIVEEIAMDVLQKLNRVDVGDLDHQITKYEQLAELQHQYFQSIPSLENWSAHQATVKRITELKMEKNMRMLRLTPDMLAHVQNSRANNMFSSF